VIGAAIWTVRLALVATAMLLIAACGGTEEASFPDDTFAVIANADIGPGPARVLVGIVQPDGTRLGSPDIGIELTAAPFDDVTATQTVTGTFNWIVEDVVGVYRAEFVFDRSGTWEIVVQPEAGEALDSAAVNVLDRTFSPNVGEPARMAPTPTLADHTLAELTTDPAPDTRFYETSLEDAIASGKSTVLVFSTPAYCQTLACGPMLEIVKEAADDYPDVNFIHVEVYTGLTEPDFQPDAAHLAPAAGPEFWYLITEPWVFVIDPSGTVTARFEGVMASQELRDAL